MRQRRSARLLDDSYFNVLKTGQAVVDGVSVLNETLLIPFKVRAFLDLSRREAKGEKGVKSDASGSVAGDVFRMLRLVTLETRVKPSEPILADLRMFAVAIEADKDFDIKAFGMEMGTAEASR